MVYRISGLALCLTASFAAAAPAQTVTTLSITAEHAPPSSMLDGNVVTGRETDKVREMMARTNTPYKIELLPWKRAYTMALTLPNTCVYSTSRTPERDKLFKWVGPTDEAEWVFYGRPDRNLALRTLEDARPLRIGTYNGDARDEFLRKRGFNVDPATNDLVNPQKLLLNRIDLWAVGIRMGSPAYTQFEGADQIKPLLVFNRVKVYLACHNSVPDALVSRLNAAVAEMRRDGTMGRLEQKYQHWSAPK
ncbi:transporter substrate-binding domain-containing protein [Oxalobacteraceae bacterium]|nr:transporter substrate-binding domain-containing protein [Oxalobacteraceae bacterium]